jgi:hypothetical protein
MLPRVSRVWERGFRLLYRILGWLDPLIRSVWSRAGLGNVVELRVASRRSARTRSVLVGILRTPEGLYLGHPNGASGWTMDLDAAGGGQLVLHGLPPLDFRAVLLAGGSERDAAIAATNQHPFPGNLVYRLARPHVRAVGRYYRLEPVAETSGDGSVTAEA